MIKIAQISPFDKCNSKCWYCPVRYYDQPKEYIYHMKPELFEKIIKNLVDEKGKTVDPKFDFIYTGHYNEILLYQYLPEMLEILRKYSIKTMILTNGIAFTLDKINLIKQYLDVVVGINFNTPILNSAEWALDTQQNKNLFPLENIKAVFAEFGQLASLGMNGIDREKTQKRVDFAKFILPDMNIYPVIGLCDRAGLLKEKGILSNEPQIKSQSDNYQKIVVGCSNGEGGRIEGWLHVNALGKAFLCCNDYFFDHEFGDFNTQSLSEIWKSEAREQAVNKAKNGLCKKCAFATWESPKRTKSILTIGMATYNNDEQIWWTVQALKLYHDLTDVEILVVDNFGSDNLKNWCQNTQFKNVKYHRCNEIQGTAYPRNKVFELASGEFVLCIDSHVMLAPGSIEKLKLFIEKNRDKKDLFHGPMLYDDFEMYADSMIPQWEGSMFGIWNNVKEIPSEPYEIPMHGLGLFGCFKDAWLGFNPDFRGFGGEEGYIHAKYRLTGQKVILLPFLKWVHRFTDHLSKDRPHNHSSEQMIKNYLIGWLELKQDISSIVKWFKNYEIAVNGCDIKVVRK